MYKHTHYNKDHHNTKSKTNIESPCASCEKESAPNIIGSEKINSGYFRTIPEKNPHIETKGNEGQPKYIM